MRRQVRFRRLPEVEPITDDEAVRLEAIRHQCAREMSDFDALPKRVREAMAAHHTRCTARFSLERHQDGMHWTSIVSRIRDVRPVRRYVAGTNLLDE